MKNKGFTAAAGAKSAFTLAEMLITLLIVSILTAVTLPIMTKKSKTRTQPTVQTPIGAIVLYAGAVPPPGWVECDGRKIRQPKYAKLIELMGKDTVPVLVGMPSIGNSDNKQQDIMAEMTAMMQNNQDMSKEEMLQQIAERNKNVQVNTGEAVKWIIRAE